MAVVPEAPKYPFNEDVFRNLDREGMAQYMRQLVNENRRIYRQLAEVINQNSRQLGDVAGGDYREMSPDGDITFHGGAGLNYGCIGGHAVAFDTVLAAQDTWYQVLAFADNNQSNGEVIPDHTEDHLTVNCLGDYLTTIAVYGHSHQVNDFEIRVFVNNGTSDRDNLTIHTTTAVAGRSVGGSMSCYAQFPAGATVEAWIKRTDGGAVSKTWTTDHIILNVMQVGGGG